jgi:hypothetical protein
MREPRWLSMVNGAADRRVVITISGDAHMAGKCRVGT